MGNLYTQFRKLLPSDPLLVGTVTAHDSDGYSLVELPGGGGLRVQGQGVAVGSKAFVQGGRVVAEAPALDAVEVLV